MNIENRMVDGLIERIKAAKEGSWLDARPNITIVITAEERDVLLNRLALTKFLHKWLDEVSRFMRQS